MSSGRNTSRSPGSPAYRTALYAVTVGTLVSAYLLVVLGDTVRVTESGMGCRSWPLCNGNAGLAGTYHAVLEQLHRYLAAVVTILVVAAFALAWRRAHRDRLVYWSAAGALGLIGVQVLLGAVTVFAHNAGWTVALHLAAAWLVVGAVTVTVLGVWRAPPIQGESLQEPPAQTGSLPASRALPGSREEPPVPAGSPVAPVPPPGRPAPRAAPTGRAAPAGRLGLAAAGTLFVLSVSGMLVLHDGASNACPGWPVCGRTAASGGLVTLQYVHRSLALVATVIVVAAAVRAWRSASAGPWDRGLAAAAMALLAGTAVVGAIVATTGAPPAEQDLHLALASALWIAVVGLATPGAPGASHRIARHDARPPVTSTGALG